MRWNRFGSTASNAPQASSPTSSISWGFKPSTARPAQNRVVQEGSWAQLLGSATRDRPSRRRSVMGSIGAVTTAEPISLSSEKSRGITVSPWVGLRGGFANRGANLGGEAHGNVRPCAVVIDILALLEVIERFIKSGEHVGSGRYQTGVLFSGPSLNDNNCFPGGIFDRAAG